MTEDLHEAETGGAALVFSDEATGVRFQIRSTELHSADEVQDAIEQDGTPEFGRWLPIEVDADDGWLLIPGEMLEELQRHEAAPGETFEVTRCEKSGSGETDPWEVNLKALDDDTQTRL